MPRLLSGGIQATIHLVEGPGCPLPSQPTRGTSFVLSPARPAPTALRCALVRPAVDRAGGKLHPHFPSQETGSERPAELRGAGVGSGGWEGASLPSCVSLNKA